MTEPHMDARMTDPPTFDVLDTQWSGTLTVLKKSKGISRDENDRLYYLAYNVADSNPGGAVCNRLHGSGSICRLPRNHIEEQGVPHMEFDPNLVVASGIYVDQIAPDPNESEQP